MSVLNSATRQPAPYSPLRGLVARHPAVAFLVLAFGFGWTSLIPILLSENGFGVLPIELPLTVVQTLATVLGLALPAFLVTAATGGKKGARDLLGRLLRWRVGLHWYLLVLFGLPVGVLLSATAQARRLRSLGDKPLAVVSAGTQSSDWLTLQDDLATLSPNSIHRVVEGATHTSVVYERSDAQATSTAIVNVVAAVRNNQPLEQ